MSGFSGGLGDVFTLLALANQIRNNFKDAPHQLSAISDLATNLENVLALIRRNRQNHVCNEEVEKSIQKILRSCQATLEEAEKISKKYQLLSIKGGGFGTKFRQICTRLRWDPEDGRRIERRINSSSSMLSTFLHEVTDQRLIAQHQDSERQNILDWLTQWDQGLQQSDHFKRRAPFTGRWLIKSKEYNDWLRGSNMSLILTGMPGSGKTMLISIIINDIMDHFWEDTDTGIAYLYCDYSKTESQTAPDLVAGLLKQLSARLGPSLPDNVKALYNKHKERRTRPDFEELSKLFQSVAALFSRVFVLVDAIDECEDSETSEWSRTNLLKQLALAQERSRVNVLITAREGVGTEKLEGRIPLEIRARDEDVRHYLDAYMAQDQDFVKQSPEIQEKIKARIVSSVQGMFLLAKLYLRLLKEGTSAKEMRRNLEDLPTGANACDKVYAKTMQLIERHSPARNRLAKEVISWIAHAKRPITTHELEHAIAVEPHELQLESLDKENIRPVEDLVSVCAGLVVIDNESNLVRLVHFTAKTYFNHTHQRWFPNVELKLAQACVTYLAFDTFSSGWCQTDQDFDSRLQENPLYDYSARNWGHHFRAAFPTIGIDSSMLRFLESEPKVAGASQAMLAYKDYRHCLDTFPRKVTAVHIAAYFNLPNVISGLLNNGYNPLATDSNGHTPLMWAIGSAHGEKKRLTEILLKETVNVNTHDRWNQTVLHHAAMKGQTMALSLLMERRPNLEARDFRGRTPLLAAANKGENKVVKLLLDAGANQNALDKHAKGILHLAIEGKNTSIEFISLLLQWGVVTTMTDRYNMSPLHSAIRYKRTDIADLLLQNGVHIDFGVQRQYWALQPGEDGDVYKLDKSRPTPGCGTQGQTGYTGLHFAALAGEPSMVEWCLRQGADPNAVSSHQETPLQLTLYNLARGTRYRDAWNTNAIRPRLTPMMKFRRFGKEDADEEDEEELRSSLTHTRAPVIEMLLRDSRTDVLLLGTYGSSILHMLNYSDPEVLTIVQMLLLKGADPCARNAKGQTPLHFASRAGNLPVLKVLIAAGADTGALDDIGKSSVHYGTKGRNPEVVTALFQNLSGSIPDYLALGDSHGRTALHDSLGSSTSIWYNMIQCLLRLGANVNSTDIYGNSPLAHYITHVPSHLSSGICQSLLKMGTYAELENKAGKSLAELYAAHPEVQADILEVFYEYQVDLNITTSDGGTLLHVMALHGSLTEEALEFLLSNTKIDPNAKDFSGKTALQCAVQKDQDRDEDCRNPRRWARGAKMLRRCTTEVERTSEDPKMPSVISDCETGPIFPSVPTSIPSSNVYVEDVIQAPDFNSRVLISA